jgi:CHAD domain-containing protein
MAKPKNIAGVNWDGHVADTIRLVLIARFDEMCALRDQALNWADPEGVHDMRVSSRRLRGALHDFMPYLHKRKLSTVLKQIENLADALGEVRDQDVAIMGLQKLASGAPIEAAAVVDQLIQARETIRKQARKDLQRELLKSRLTQCQKDFATALDAATAPSKSGKRLSQTDEAQGEVTYRDVARRTITNRLKEVEKLSAGLYQPLKIKPLHRMRIGAKHLRYALELFEPCWGTGISIFAKRIAALQSSLGELHDSHIWIGTFGKHLRDGERQPMEQGGAALWLLSHFVKLHSKHLRSSLENWSEWQAKECGARLRETIEQDFTLAVQSIDPVLPNGEKEITIVATSSTP